MTGSTSLVSIDGVTYQVNFHPNEDLLVRECPEAIQEESSSDSSYCSSSASSSSSNSVEGDVQKKKKTKKKRFGFSLSFKKSKKNKKKSRTNKKLKGKSKMAFLKTSAAATMEAWKLSIGGYSKVDEEPDDDDFEELFYNSGSLFAGRLEDDDDITKLPTIREETCELQEPALSSSSSPQKKVITQNLVVEERTCSKRGFSFVIRRKTCETPTSPTSSPRKNNNNITQNLVVEERKPSNKKGWKLVKRIFMKLHVASSQSSVADTCSLTTSSPRTMAGDDDDDHDSHLHTHHDDDANHRDDDGSVYALASVEETFFSLNSELSTLHQEDQLSSPSSSDDLPPSLTMVPCVAQQQTSCVTAKFVFKGSVPPQVDAEYPSDEEEEECSVDSIVSPVPNLPAAATTTTTATTTTPRKKILNYKKAKKTSNVVVVAAPTTTVAKASGGWNVWALLLVAVLCAISIASRLMMTFAGLPTSDEIFYYYEMEVSDWPFDECLSSEAPVTSYFSSFSFFWLKKK